MTSDVFSTSAVHVMVSATRSTCPIVPFVALFAGGGFALTMGAALVSLPIREAAPRLAQVAI